MEKSQQNHQHQPPSPKSTRLSPSSAASSPSTLLSEKAESAPDDAWALSLHVAEQPPLSICYPVHVEDNPIRRSLRFTSNKYKTPPPVKSRSRSRLKKHTALVLSALRMSPRLASSLSAPALTLTDGDSVDSREAGPKKRRRLSEDKAAVGRSGNKAAAGSLNGNSRHRLLTLPGPGSKSKSRGCLSERCLRSRTVLMQVGDEGDFRIKERCLRTRVVRYAVVESPKASEKRVVRSDSDENCLGSITERREKGNAAAKDASDYALIEWPEHEEERDWRSSEIPKIEMLALPEESSISSENCLRSKTVKIQVQEGRAERGASGVELNKKCAVTPKTELSLGESLNVSDKRDTKQCDFEGLSEKRLRSRKIQFNLNVDENAVRTPDPIGQGCNGESAVKSESNEKSTLCCFIGEPIHEEEAHKRWQWRYDLKSRKKGKNWKINADEDDEIILNVESHYAKAKVGKFVLDIGDCVFVKGEGNKKHIGRILEFFKTTEGEDYFRVQWFFRAEDTVLKEVASMNDKRRIFISTLMNDNLLDCIISKVKVVKVPPMLCLKQNPFQSAAFYYDMEYSVEYSTFRTLVTETSMGSQSFLLNSKLTDDEQITLAPLELLPNYDSPKQELALLDLYSGCGGMSTGLCLGAKLSSVNLVTKWAVDYNSAACESLKLNHPETNARNESAEDFLDLLRQWENLCKMYISDIERTLKCELEELPEAEGCSSPSDTEESTEEYEVSRLVGICYGDPNERGKRGLHFKVRWKGYGPDDDTWESAEGLSNCQERIQDFVRRGFNAGILPLPGDVDVICGGPPCQGISGYNRFRNFDSPLDDERNRQIVVFMDIVEFLKPKYCLMENVVDIIRFDKGSLGRYALSRLVLMKYQARLGTIASGCYGLPQFRLRVFIWGAHPSQTLPQFPLPTHDVVVKYWPPIEFERNIVAYDEGQPRPLEDAIVLGDSISDLPAVTNDETREEMAYEKPPETEFQRCIRLSKDVMMGRISPTDSTSRILYDHRPLKLSEHDYMRVSQIPHRKGANFRDLPGVVVGENNVARRDPTIEPVMLPTGRQLIPDCVFNFEQGKSRKPYGRLWWDETVSTVVTFPQLRSQALLHPEQDRLLTIRECARLQGFPDYYRFCGTTKERYCQIGNAVSIPVARALGYALGMAYRKAVGDGPLMTLPPKFLAELPSFSG
ncbi:chromomethylase 2 [Perilla frutescens var. frutescens]|nr:chromomethylase 2 [Perilla frutescens var. frutescens]